MTIGFGSGKERVDYITYDTKGVWKCYEIKVSKSDFYSKAAKTFVGHYNYYVLTNELYKLVKDDIPNHIGVYVGEQSVKRAKKQELAVDEQILKDSMIRSLAREFQKQYRSGNPNVVESLERQLRNAREEARGDRKRLQELMNFGRDKYGRNWYMDE
ncbi:hypothetical protein [Virgibacillus profundi]|uniref:hypothetical protein n=1 Tax=Virgibacillus profundi TaxID=2024555 RepID=UPI001F0ABDE6|nr:hypothetical protein [Virgibacillus profundi]